jgi:hypothetical protein
MPTEAFKALDGSAFAAVGDDPTVTDELLRSQTSVAKVFSRSTGIFPDLYHLRRPLIVEQRRNVGGLIVNDIFGDFPSRCRDVLDGWCLISTVIM